MYTINIGIIGFGAHMTGKLIPAIVSSQTSHKLIAGCRRSNLENTKSKYNLSYMTENYRDILLDPNINTVFIALPDPEAHFQLTYEAIVAGKNVFVEKPATISPDQFQQLALLSTKNKVITCEGFNLLHVPSISNLKQRLDQNHLVSFEINCAIQNISTRISAKSIEHELFFAFIHPLSVTMYLLGKPDDIKITNFRTEENYYNLSINFDYSNRIFKVCLNFNNHSCDGFQFSITFTDNTHQIHHIDATTKNKGVSEKQISYSRQIDKFFRSILLQQPFENSFEYNICTHQILSEIVDKIKRLYTQGTKYQGQYMSTHGLFRDQENLPTLTQEKKISSTTQSIEPEQQIGVALSQSQMNSR